MPTGFFISKKKSKLYDQGTPTSQTDNQIDWQTDDLYHCKTAVKNL